MLDTLVLLSGFISFFRQAEPHSNFQLTMKICESVLLVSFLATFIIASPLPHSIAASLFHPLMQFSSFYAEPALFRCLAYIPLLSNTTSVEVNTIICHHLQFYLIFTTTIITNYKWSYYINLCHVTSEWPGFV